MSCENKKVLIVDDDLVLGCFFQDMVKAFGFSSQTCRSPYEAVTVFEKNPSLFFGAILDFDYKDVGVLVEEANGITLARQLKHIAQNAGIPDFPMILVSATEFNPGQLQQLKALAVPNLKKPFDFDELEMRVIRMARAGLEVLV